jgi:putative ABC transport system ATP-binding protein
MGYIFQSFHLLQGCTALENLLVAMSFAGKVDSSRAKELLKVVGLAKRMNHKPNELSIGQQQRVALARAVVNQPSLILADEPTGNLDERNTQVSLDILKELCEVNEASMIIVSHDPKVISSFETKMNWSDLNRVQENPLSKND